MPIVFWVSFAAVLYIYLGYPLLLTLLGRLRTADAPFTQRFEPSVTVIIPVHNEERVIAAKLRNTLDLDYPAERLQVIVVSDASTDGTHEIVRGFGGEGVELRVLGERMGKSAALNLGLGGARHEIIVFSDASIILDSRALSNLVRPFASDSVGCVSGEDYVPGRKSEGAYGRYELLLRNLESRVSSIVGASGCFYAQRRHLCDKFLAGMAPDFLSVLSTVKQGFSAKTEPSAFGEMGSVAAPGREFQRKTRTVLRGITTLMHFRSMLNPFRHGLFAVQLISHKVLRWATAVFLLAMAVSSAFLWNQAGFGLMLILQLLFYALAVIGWLGPQRLASWSPFRIPFFFCLVNAAALAAIVKYHTGSRVEVWEPSRR
jgi:hypothetical protein